MTLFSGSYLLHVDYVFLVFIKGKRSLGSYGDKRGPPPNLPQGVGLATRYFENDDAF